MELDINDMKKCIKQMDQYNHQDHKTLQDAIQESMTHMNDWKARLTQEITTLKTNYTSLLDEHRTLESQVQQLRTFRAAASPELEGAKTFRRELEARHGALCDCLISTGHVQAERLQARVRALAGISSMDCALSTSQALLAVAGFAGDSGTSLAAMASSAEGMAGTRAALALERADGSLAPRRGLGTKALPSLGGAPTLHDLDEGSWRSLEEFRPSQAVLGEWAKSDMVQHAFGSFGVQGVMGVPEVINYSDVFSIFNQIELSLEQFVNNFTYLPSVSATTKASDLKAKASFILRHVATEKADGEERIATRDVYRLLELVGFPLSRFKAIFKSDDEGEGKPESQLKIGSYHIRRQIGQGFHGVCCYLGEKASDSSERVAVKWPASRDEISVLQDIRNRTGKDVLGVPRLIDHGISEGQPYLVTDLLGSTLSSVFELISTQQAPSRWPALRLLGRLIVRRLQALHMSGFVHCDMSPDNVLVGRGAQSRGGAKGSPSLALYLIDFELAQRCPGGKKLDPDQGSAEWSSIRSAEGGERLPEDDLEAVGWVLLNGLAGALPWFEWLQAAYKDWDSKYVRRQATRQVQRAKILILEEGWAALSKKPLKLPEDLARFLCACRQPRPEGQELPDYQSLLRILGQEPSLTGEEADRRDLLEFSDLSARISRPSSEQALSCRRLQEAVDSKALSRKRLQEAVASKDQRRICAALRDAESAGLSETEMADARIVLDEGDVFG